MLLSGCGTEFRDLLQFRCWIELMPDPPVFKIQYIGQRKSGRIRYLYKKVKSITDVLNYYSSINVWILLGASILQDLRHWQWKMRKSRDRMKTMIFNCRNKNEQVGSKRNFTNFEIQKLYSTYSTAHYCNLIFNIEKNPWKFFETE